MCADEISHHQYETGGGQANGPDAHSMEMAFGGCGSCRLRLAWTAEIPSQREIANSPETYPFDIQRSARIRHRSANRRSNAPVGAVYDRAQSFIGYES